MEPQSISTPKDRLRNKLKELGRRDIRYPDPRFFYPDLGFLSDFSYMNKIPPHINLSEFSETGTAGKVGTVSFNKKLNQALKKQPADSTGYVHIDFVENPKPPAPSPSIYNTLDADYMGGRLRGFVKCGSGSFTNQSIQSEIMDMVLSSRGVGGYVKQENFWTAGGLGYTIMPKAEGSLHDYFNNPENCTDFSVRKVLHDVLLPLSILKCSLYQFCHCDLKCKNVFYTNNKFMIADFDKSQIFWYGYRFRFESDVGEWSKYVGMGVNVTATSSTYKLTVSAGKVVGGYAAIALANAIMMTDSMVPMSYDIYTLFLSIICHPKIIGIWRERSMPILNNMFDILFPKIQEDVEKKVMEAIAYQGKTWWGEVIEIDSIKQYGYILYGLPLQKDISQIYEMLDLHPPSTYDAALKNITAGEVPVLLPLLLSDNEGGGGRSKHICTTACINGVCSSNRYSTSGPLGVGKFLSWTKVVPPTILHDKGKCK